MSMTRAATLYFAIVFAAGFVLGLIRVPFLVPRLGERMAELIEMPLMFVVIVLAARHIVYRFQFRPVRTLPVGFGALALLVSAELLLGIVLQGRSLGQYFLSRDPVSGVVYLIMLLAFALMPYIIAGRQKAAAGTKP